MGLGCLGLGLGLALGLGLGSDPNLDPNPNLTLTNPKSNPNPNPNPNPNHNQVPLSEERLAAEAAAQLERAVAGGAQGAGALPLGPLPPVEEQRGSGAAVSRVELTLEEEGARSY